MFEQHKITHLHGRDVALTVAVLGGLGTALGIAIRRNAHKLEETQVRQPNPAILTSERLNPEARQRINRVAAFILMHDRPDQQSMIERYNFTKVQTGQAVGYLRDNNLIRRTFSPSERKNYYVPLPGLVLAALEAAKNEENYPDLSAAVQEIADTNQELPSPGN